MSAHLNYFFPYSATHGENNLTRAFLVVLRYSPLAQALFYELVREQIAIAALPNLAHRLPAINELPWADIQIETQAGNLREWSAGQLVSVLISSTITALSSSIKPVERQAVYDGFMLLDERVMLLIENKPHDNYWADQLNPAIRDVGPEIIVIPQGVALRWQEIISIFQRVEARSGVTDQERFIINDFFEYVDQEFPQLNPYDKLGRCKNDQNLLNRRLERILAEVGNGESPSYHQGWCYYLSLHKYSAQKVGIKLDYNPQRADEWKIDLLWYPGNSMTQARALHTNPALASGLATLKSQADGERWSIGSNFHLHKYPVGNLFWAYGFDDPLESYLDFWQNVVKRGELYQRSKDDTVQWLRELRVQNQLQFSDATLQKEVIDPGYQTYNICPGIEMVYTLTAKEAIALDDREELALLLREKIIQVNTVLT